jgi:hypothetical protein
MCAVARQRKLPRVQDGYFDPQPRDDSAAPNWPTPSAFLRVEGLNLQQRMGTRLSARAGNRKPSPVELAPNLTEAPSISTRERSCEATTGVLFLGRATRLAVLMETPQVRLGPLWALHREVCC